MTEQYRISSDYVDVHGRRLNMLVKSDGTLFVPFHEIRKTGFHVFPKENFVHSSVTKKIIMDEFQLYLLGAAREFLIQREIGKVNSEDIKKTIEDCYNILSPASTQNQPNNSTSGVLGRTLLMPPNEVNKIAKSALNPSNSTENLVGVNQNTRRNNFRPSTGDSSSQIRLPHQQNDYPKPADDEDHNRRPNIKNTLMKRNQQRRNSNQSETNRYAQNDQNRHTQNEQNRYSQNNGKMPARRNDESKSASENEENGQQFIRLSDLNVKRIELKKDVQEVKVVHKDVQNEKFKYWVQLAENDKIVMDIIEKCFEISDDAAVVRPTMNEMYLAQSKEDELWYRVIVSRVSPVVKVHFIDFGNDAVVSEVREIPSDLKSIPAQAVKMVLSSQSSMTELQLEETLSVQYVKQYDDTTYLMTATNKKPTQSLEPVFISKIKYSTVLTEKDIVKIVSHSEGKLYLRNKEHHEKLVEVDIEIKHFKRELVKDVVVNQLILCKKEGSEEKLCRGIVKKVGGSKVTVHYMDYHMDDEVPVNTLYGVDKMIAGLPSTLIESPVLKGYSSAKFDDNAASLLDEMIMNNVKFTVALGNDFDLLLKDMASLSEMLFPTPVKPKPVTPESNKVMTTKKSPGNVQKSEDKYVKVMYEDMLTYEPPMGKGDYMLTNFKDSTDFTVTSTEDKESDLLSRCTGIDVTDPVPYEPEDSEMVLACFDGDWYRALVLDKSDSGLYQILFVEYGNIIEVSMKDIRRFPKEFKNIPILGLACQMQIKDDEVVRRRLEKLLETDNIYEINFLSYSVDNLQYTVEIPKIQEILVQEGLI